MLSPRELSEHIDITSYRNTDEKPELFESECFTETDQDIDKDFMFRERVQLESERETLKQYQEILAKEKQQFMSEMKEWNRKFELEKNRLKEEQKLFERKLQILQNAYHQLELDKKAVENEKRSVHLNKEFRSEQSNVIQYISIRSFFKGVTNILTLKKRYKDLMKIFHPDNVCGDSETVKMINAEYQVLKQKYENEM